jgi:hypothetical protein
MGDRELYSEGSMNDTQQLEEALALVLQLTPGERLKLVERVVASVEREMVGSGSAASQDTDNHWGQALNRLLDTLDTGDWEALDIDDPVAWVKSQRREDESRLDTYWTDSE